MKSTIDTLSDEQKKMYDEIIDGLQERPRTLPCKYFYDEKGSQLFDRICELDAYYPTRTEMEIMEQNIDEMVNLLGEDIQLVEFGSGSSLKTRMILERLPGLTYVPVDISEEHLQKSTEDLRRNFPNLDIKPVCADYTHPFELPELDEHHTRRVIYFPGSTIGNFAPENAKQFLALIAEEAGDNGSLLIGVDLKKEAKTLLKAYNDDEGVTAEFNKNLLKRLNRDLGADFRPECFRHEARYQEREGRVELHLRCIDDHTVTIGEHTFDLKEGETIHTENSYKYSVDGFQQLASKHFEPVQTWTDPQQFFSIQYLNVR